jgi:multidrug efflux pump subunit AcrA (membrane-fusion protein)
MKTNTIKQLVMIVFGLVLFLSACSPGAEETAAPEPIAPAFRPLVSVTGVVVPEQEALLSVSAGGVVEDVLVSKGDQVNAGQVLVQLEGTEQQLAAVSGAELELANAKFALDALYKDTDLLASQALNSAETAEQAL